MTIASNKTERARDPTAPPTTSELQPTVFPASQARANFMEVIGRVRFGRERLVITNKGKPAVALVTMEDLKLLQLLDDVDLKELIHDRVQNEEKTDRRSFRDFLDSCED